MKSRWISAFLIVAGLGFTAAPASAQVFTLTAKLTGAGELTTTTPAINTAAFGDATIVLDVGAAILTYTVRVFDLPSGVTASHIHVGAAGTAGPTVVNFSVPTPASNDFTFSGTVAFSAFTLRQAVGIGSAEDMVQAIVGENTYVNVHTQVNPGGEIRGQLFLKQ